MTNIAITTKPNPAAVVTPMGIAITLSLLGDLALFASLPMNVAVVGISVANLGLIFGIHRLIRIPGNALGGMLINQRRRRPFFLSGTLFAILSTLGYGFANNLTSLILCRLGWGIAWILLYLCSMAMLIDITEEHNRGKWMGVFNTWYLVGIAGGSFLGGFLSDRIGFRDTMFMCAGLSLLGFLEALIFLPETAQIIQQSNSSEENLPRLQKIAAYKTMLLTTPGLLLILGVYLINQFAAEGVALSVLSLLLNFRLGEGITIGTLALGISSLSGFLLAFRYVLSAVISPFAGSLSDRIHSGRFMILTAGLILSIFSFLLIGFGQSLPIIIAGIILNAIGGGGMMVALSALLGDIAPKNAEGEILGIYATAGDIGSALGPMFAYFLMNYVPISNVFFVCGFLFTISFLFVLANKRNLTSKDSSVS